MIVWVLLVAAISITPSGDAFHQSAVYAFETREHCERLLETVTKGLKNDKPTSKIISGCVPIDRPVKS